MRDALERRMRVLGTDHAYTLTSRNNLTVLLLRTGRGEEAVPIMREIMETSRRTLTDAHPNTILSIYNYGDVLRDLGRFEEAEELLREAVALGAEHLTDGHWHNGLYRSRLGELLLETDRAREAEPELLAGHEAIERQLGPRHARTLRVGFTSAASLNPLVPAVISGFREAYPDVELRLVVQPTTPLLVQLSQDTIDVAFVSPTSTERELFRAIQLPDERLWIALPAGHVLAARKWLRLEDLRNEPFIMYPRANGSLLYDAIIAACQNAGTAAPLPRVHRCDSMLLGILSLLILALGVYPAPLLHFIRLLVAAGGP